MSSEALRIDPSASPWNVLAPAELQRLHRDARLVERARGEAFLRQGEAPRGLYFVIAGDVLLEQFDTQGTYTAFRIAGAGDLFGYRSLFALEPHATTALALKRSRVARVSGTTIEALMASNPALARAFLTMIATDPGPVYAPLLRSPLLPATVRLAHLLLILKDRYARPFRAGALYYELPLSQEQIGGLIGARRESVSRLFKQFDAAGVCRQRGRKIVVPSIERLRDYAGLEHEVG